MNQLDKSEEQIYRETATMLAFWILCLGLLLVTPADMAAQPPVIATAIVCLLSGITLASILRRRSSCGDLQRAALAEAAGCSRTDQLQGMPQLQDGAGKTELMVAVSRRKLFSHKVWTRAEGFTLSGNR